jgi:putative Mg2+ transporter-C (MgtC) family protein
MGNSGVTDIIRIFIDLWVALMLGGLIGFERQWRRRGADLRAYVLAAVVAAAFVEVGGGGQTVGYVVVGVALLGAAVLMKADSAQGGLNTAVTLSGAAVAGAFVGSGKAFEAVLVAGFVVAANSLLRPLVDYVDRSPASPEKAEAVWRVHVTCRPEQVAVARRSLSAELTAPDNVIGGIETASRGAAVMELTAILAATHAKPDDLDAAVTRLASHEEIESASWTVSPGA